MPKRMLIDASHPEETRVAVLNGKRLEEFDYETTARKPLKGNIYLAKITRVEPSLQAAFVDYGGNRHGFLPFTEIHPDYYRIPIADREALIAEEAALKGDSTDDDEADGEAANGAEESSEGEAAGAKAANGAAGEKDAVMEVETETGVDTVGGDEMEEDRRKRAKLLRRYKIQEVIKRRQVILVQVSKEERGNKGAALTTYLSLAGRYCVLMPNTARGGGISRKIGSANDRRRLKSIISELKIPEGMAVIVRTAGSQRSKPEIKRDYEYLLRLWDEIRRDTLESSAPSLIYEEGDLVKRTIRDLYSREMEEILIEGEDGYKAAKTFMKTLMPSHARHVKLYKDPAIPLLQRHQVEAQVEAIHNPVVELASGGYIVISPTEALVSIDINSGRATKERHIETTALKTNLEAAEEIARQLRLRDLAGLIVIDFIDMEEPRHNRDVERRLKEAMRHDRARIQLGRISHFGLLEMSRQRLRPSLIEASTVVCQTCQGTGHIRTSDSSALQVLRVIEEQGIKRGAATLTVTVHPDVALYLFNQMRDRLIAIEQRYGLRVSIKTDATLVPPDHRLETVTATGETVAIRDEAEASEGDRRRRRRRSRRGKDSAAEETTEEAASEAEPQEERPEAEAEASEDGERPRRRRRGKRGGRRRSRRRQEGETDTDVEAAERSEDAVTEAPEPALEPAQEPSPETAATADAVADSADPETTQSEAQSVQEPDKPKRRRRSRKKAEAPEAEATDAEATVTGAAEADAPEAESPEAEAQPTQEAEKPKRRRRSRRKTEDSAEAAAKSKPRKKGGAAAAATKETEAEAAPEPQATPDPVAEAAPDPRPEAVPESAPDPKLTANGEAEPNGSSDPKSRTAAEDAPPPPQEAEDDKPKRKGWWNRLGG
ncbi:MAG: Rne/Rng family ribonuclease [Kiloniellales bacterium]|nr:Rne/Rng family ribonuclease [Kiloniellales bacterium]